MSKLSKRIPCRFCDWSTPSFRTTKKGKTSGPDAAFARLKDHVFMHHDGPYETVVAFVAATPEPECEENEASIRRRRNWWAF
jgi:hypothetical protein